MSVFKGSGVALVTPFANGNIDYFALDKLLELQISSLTDALVICGTTGEASTLTDEEHIEVVSHSVKKTAKRIPVIAGGGSNDTAHAAEMSKKLADKGADAILSVTPYYNKCTQSGLKKHYEKIADVSPVPIILYSVASRTSVNILPETAEYLSKHDNITGIKEASGNISQVCKIAAFAGDNFSLYSGNDDMVVPLMAVGGHGVISTAANIIPADVKKMVDLCFENRYREAFQMQANMTELIDCLFMEVNPVPVKAALNIMGYIEREYRLPLTDPDNRTLFELWNALMEYGVKVD